MEHPLLCIGMSVAESKKKWDRVYLQTRSHLLMKSILLSGFFLDVGTDLLSAILFLFHPSDS